MQELNYEYYCLRCKHFDEDYGVCRKFNENVVEYPDKFKKKCNSKYFATREDSFIDDKIERYENKFSNKIKINRDDSSAKSKIKLDNISPAQFIIIATDIIELFKWSILYIKKKEISAFTNNKDYDCNFNITITDKYATIECRNDELFSSSKWIKDNIELFLEKYYDVLKVENFEVIDEKRSFDIHGKKEVDNYINKLIRENKEVNTRLSEIYITLGLITANVLIFIIIYFSYSIYQTDYVSGFIDWGANVKRLTEGGQWWRLITAVFLHGGFFHLLYNMIALFWMGSILEPILDHFRFLVFYFIMGIVASHCGIYFASKDLIILGASGAIFGLFGIYFALLNSSLFHRKTKKVFRRNIFIFIAYALLSSFRPGIDIAGHIGGFVSGLIIGYIIVLTSKSKHILKEINDL